MVLKHFNYLVEIRVESWFTSPHQFDPPRIEFVKVGYQLLKHSQVHETFITIDLRMRLVKPLALLCRVRAVFR